jgi:phosphoserine phosphatase
MKIALFLDVDKTLTRNYIQQDYARSLGCEGEYAELEKKFQTKETTSQQFGEELVRIFAEKRFNVETAEKLFYKVELQPWADQLLRSSVDKFLVSSGPSYYIDRLAKEYGIPQDHTCRSEYRFDKGTAIIKECSSVNELQKAHFVKERGSQYGITIGIGDSPLFDGPFVSHCTIPLITVSTGNFIHLPNFNLAIDLVQKLSAAGSKVAKDIKPEEMTIPEVVRVLPVKHWIFIAGALVTVLTGAFGLGAKIGPSAHPPSAQSK